MKKTLLAVLLTLCLFFTLTGCGKKEVDSNIEDIETNTSTNTSTNTTSDEEVKLYSDGTKYVFEYTNTKYVFYYSGNKITKYETYVDYETASSASTVYATIKLEQYPEVKNVTLKGRYVVFEWNESVYKDLTADNLKTVYSYMKEVKE